MKYYFKILDFKLDFRHVLLDQKLQKLILSWRKSSKNVPKAILILMNLFNWLSIVCPQFCQLTSSLVRLKWVSSPKMTPISKFWLKPKLMSILLLFRNEIKYLLLVLWTFQWLINSFKTVIDTSLRDRPNFFDQVRASNH
jgi:hypothetical protein